MAPPPGAAGARGACAWRRNDGDAGQAAGDTGFIATVERIAGHAAAVLLGFVLMVVGLGLGVTMIMLPVGLVIGLAGLLAFVWGLVGHLERDG